MLNLFAAIDQDDTNWIIILKDVGPDPSVRTARPGEREIATDLPERELTRGWLKASNRALDPARSKPWKPWHKLTRQARQKVTPGKIEEYSIELLRDGEPFPQKPPDLRRGHKSRSFDRHSRRDQYRIYSLSLVLEPDRDSQHLPRRRASFAFAAAGHSDRLIVDRGVRG